MQADSGSGRRSNADTGQNLAGASAPLQTAYRIWPNEDRTVIVTLPISRQIAETIWTSSLKMYQTDFKFDANFRTACPQMLRLNRKSSVCRSLFWLYFTISELFNFRMCAVIVWQTKRVWELKSVKIAEKPNLFDGQASKLSVGLSGRALDCTPNCRTVIVVRLAV